MTRAFFFVGCAVTKISWLDYAVIGQTLILFPTMMKFFLLESNFIQDFYKTFLLAHIFSIQESLNKNLWCHEELFSNYTFRSAAKSFELLETFLSLDSKISLIAFVIWRKGIRIKMKKNPTIQLVWNSIELKANEKCEEKYSTKEFEFLLFRGGNSISFERNSKRFWFCF